MKTALKSLSLNLSLCAAVLLAAGAARASEGGASPSEAPVPSSTLTRAEVLADLECWRESGMADFRPVEAEADPMSAPYRTAYAKYEALRSSPTFAQRVVRIARVTGEAVDIAAMSR